ncbi:flavoprotein-like protein [Lentinula raphanica]|nr:flavoprotein-like protein [Lentinula raphanica]
MATYGEGKPTDNAVQLMQNLQDDSFEFSKGGWDLSGLKYTYEHYNVISKYVDNALAKMGATRMGVCGEGDDDKSMEEDYLEWKDGMWEAFATAMGVEEGQGGDTADFAVRELEPHPAEKVYLGELSARALTKAKGITHAKNPYPAPLTVARELFLEVDRLLLALGLYDKIPFDMIVSSIPRLQPRYYSISSSPRLHPNSIHVTPNDRVPERWVYGVGSNFLLNLKHAATGEGTPLISDPGVAIPASQICPVVMLGPGTGVGPLPAFVQNA